MSEEKKKLPLRQKVYSRACKLLAGDEMEENVRVFNKVKGFRFLAYKFLSKRRYGLAMKLQKKNGLGTTYRS